ncbi:MAG: hypothetical protein JRG73_21135 [Deltaproteobacteria bacterium]|nr:hypothetical protein [Deltaproteobacteria bacterium]MBW2309430.1 hypothetical protein [Deltaproteobacteria bacterium]
MAVSIRASTKVSDVLANRLLELGSPGIITEDTGEGAQRLVREESLEEWHLLVWQRPAEILRQ